MKVITNIEGVESNYNSYQEFKLNSVLSEFVYLNKSGIKFLSNNIQSRFFIFLNEDTLFLSDNLSFLSNVNVLVLSKESQLFYKKFGFVIPPYTQYENVYLAAPYIEFDITTSGISYITRYPVKNEINKNESLYDILGKYFSKINQKKLDILVSGGIDSSALLGFLNSKSSAKNALMCKMSSLPNEGALAQLLCENINVPFQLIDLDKDLTSKANEFTTVTGEYISDSIALVFPELFECLSSDDQSIVWLVDGQGADSLMNGLPINKVYSLWSKIKPLRLFLFPLSFIPVYKNKSSPFKRKLYRLSKGIKCISQFDFKKSIVSVMAENESSVTDYEEFLLHEIQCFYDFFEDWNLVIRYLYLFRVLPAREMQKYLLAKRYNVKIVAPFLDVDVINSYFYADSKVTIKDGLYKYPITKLAQQYWPGYFINSKTSPFQINYKLGFSDLKDFSISKFNSFKMQK